MPKKKRNHRPEPDPRRKLLDGTDKKVKKYGAYNMILEDVVEELGEPDELDEFEDMQEEKEA
jgi:hypothetical protein